MRWAPCAGQRALQPVQLAVQLPLSLLRICHWCVAWCHGASRLWLQALTVVQHPLQARRQRQLAQAACLWADAVRRSAAGGQQRLHERRHLPALQPAHRLCRELGPGAGDRAGPMAACSNPVWLASLHHNWAAAASGRLPVGRPLILFSLPASHSAAACTPCHTRRRSGWAARTAPRCMQSAVAHSSCGRAPPPRQTC